MPLNPKHGSRIDEAARELHTTGPHLFQLLRANRIFNGKLPRVHYVQAGFFKLEQRTYTLPGTRIQRWYHIALVTPNGMALLQQLLSDEAMVTTQPERRRCTH